MASSRNRRKSDLLTADVFSGSLGLQSTHSGNDNVAIHRNWIGSTFPENFTPPIAGTSYLGRSYLATGFLGQTIPEQLKGGSQDGLPLTNRFGAKPIHEANILHKQTAEISEGFQEEQSDDSGSINEYLGLMDQEDNPTTAVDPIAYEPLLEAENRSSNYKSIETESDINTLHGFILQRSSFWTALKEIPSKTFHYLPAALLGLLLNVLDALSYGMIIFPISEPIFAHMGPTGISMFYVSCIVSQFIYSGGWSKFPSSIGSEMIEITPFYHTMAFAIQRAIPNSADEIITTTIFCYVISAMLTGVTFFILGKLNMGKLVGFFPRHILIGCIGGVGYFLVITGFEVTTRIERFQYSLPFIISLFTDLQLLLKWLVPVLLTVSLYMLQNIFKHSLVLPSFYVGTFLLFHFVVAILPNLSLQQLRDLGWIFPVAESDGSWYDFYKLFDFSKVHWWLILKNFPTMMALTFFGILHVPINVPALAMTMQIDKYDVDVELIAHGYSNFVSGLMGSVQNYLVYTNSVLFIRAGADSSFAGFLVIILTFAIMAIGPIVISIIPVCIVGSLIFLLGFELLSESLFDTWNKITKFEYVTIAIIVLTMGIFDFVLGIIVGILIACFSFLIDSSRLKTVNGEYNGLVAKSTVYRDHVQTRFLNEVGEQIYVLKLQNLLFFGTILSIEEKVEKILEISSKDSSKRRIKYLVLDFKNINADNIDHSAAEGFNRIKRFTESRRIRLVISTIRNNDKIYNAFNKVGLLNDVELFKDLNSALEWCENEFLAQYKRLREKVKQDSKKSTLVDLNSTLVNANLSKFGNNIGIIGDAAMTDQDNGNPMLSVANNTPRNRQILKAARTVYSSEEQLVKSLKPEFPTNKSPVLPLLLYTLKPYKPDILAQDNELRTSVINIWSKLCPYFKYMKLAAQTQILHKNNVFFLVETGIIKATYVLPQGRTYETMSNGTCFGKIIGKASISSQHEKSLDLKTEVVSTLWVMNETALEKLRDEIPELYTELILLVMYIRDSRFKQLLGYAFVSS